MDSIKTTKKYLAIVGCALSLGLVLTACGVDNGLPSDSSVQTTVAKAKSLSSSPKKGTVSEEPTQDEHVSQDSEHDKAQNPHPQEGGEATNKESSHHDEHKNVEHRDSNPTVTVREEAEISPIPVDDAPATSSSVQPDPPKVYQLLYSDGHSALATDCGVVKSSEAALILGGSTNCETALRVMNVYQDNMELASGDTKTMQVDNWHCSNLPKEEQEQRGLKYTCSTNEGEEIGSPS